MLVKFSYIWIYIKIYGCLSSQNISGFMGSKTLQIHCYCRISQEQSSSTITFQALIWSEIVGYGRWKMVTLGEAHSLSTPQSAIMGKVWLLWVFRSLENGFVAIAHLKKLSDIDAHNKHQPQSPCTFMQISLYIILLTHNSVPSKIVFPNIFIYCFANPQLYSI